MALSTTSWSFPAVEQTKSIHGVYSLIFSKGKLVGCIRLQELVGHLFQVVKKRTHVFEMILTSYSLLLNRKCLFGQLLPHLCWKFTASVNQVVLQLGKDGINLIVASLRQLIPPIFRWTDLLRKGMCFFANVSAHLFASHSLDHILPIVFSKHEFSGSIWKCSLYAKGTKLLSCKFGIFFGLFFSTEFPQYFQAVTIPVGSHRVYIFVIIK